MKSNVKNRAKDGSYSWVDTPIVPLANAAAVRPALLLAAVLLAFAPGLGLGADSPAAAAGPAALLDLSLEELGNLQVPMVYGASKREQKTSEAPSSVSIVTADEIKKYGHQTLADVLRSVRGFYVSYDRSYTYIGVRGVNRPGDYGGRVLTTVDGHRVNEPLYDTAFSGTEGVVDVDLIERVEIIRGPGSALYGNNAFFAVINIVTKNGRDYQGGEVAGAVASYDTYAGRLTYGNRFHNGVELLLSGTYLDSAGHERLSYPEFSSINQGVAEHRDGTSLKSVFGKLAYRDFTLEGAFMDRRKDLPTASYGTVFNAPDNFTQDQRAYGSLKYQHAFENEWEVMGRVYYDHYRYDAAYPYDYLDPQFPGRITSNRDLANARSLSTEWQVGKTLWERHRLTAGFEYRAHLRLELENFDVAPAAKYLDSHSSGDSYALFLQDEFSLRTNLVLSAGARYDYFSTFGGTFNPRAALIYSPVPASTFKLLYGEAFRAPNTYEVRYAGTGYKSNPSLEPETIRSYELVFEQGLGAHLRGSASLFRSEITGLIAETIDPLDGKLYFDNLDAVTSQGVETELEGVWAGGLRGRISYSYADARESQTGQRLSNSPRHLAKLNVSVPLYADKLFASLELQGMSARSTVRGGEVGAFGVANFTLFSRELAKGLEASVSIYNLLDQKFRDPVSSGFTQDAIQQDGRSFRVKLQYRF